MGTKPSVTANQTAIIARHVQESQEHVARIVARIAEFNRSGMTQAANEQKETLLALRKVLATDREHLLRAQRT